jgi:predicted TIM-barrel fold metal-dependent hydrolase
MLVTDAQIHLWDIDRPERPWPKDARSKPHRPGAFLAPDMLAEMDAAGVDRAVIVPPSWAGESNELALEAAAAHPNRFAVMGRFDPLAPGALDQLASWRQRPGLLGIRHTFNTPTFRSWLDDDTLEPFWTAAERAGLPLMCQFSTMLEKVPPIAERHPDLTIVIDHMGRLSGQKGAAAWTDLPLLLALARYPKVTVKMTSAPSYSVEPYPHRDQHTYLRQIFDAFGPRRLLWGSDITRLPGTYRHCLTLFQEELDFLSADDQEWILGKSIASICNWPEA